MINKKISINSFLTLRFTEMTDVDFINKFNMRRKLFNIKYPEFPILKKNPMS